MQFSTKSLLLAATMVACVAAEATEIQMFNAGDVTLPAIGLVASVVGANAEATTLAIQCGEDSSNVCQLNEPATITQGPSTFTMSMVMSTTMGGLVGTATMMQDCDITASTEGASCSISVGVQVSSGGLSTSTAITTATSVDSDEIYYRPVTVTAGVEKLNAPAATETPDAAAGSLSFGGAAAAAIVAAIVL